MTIRERIARAMCVAEGGNPDHSLGGDKQNWLWHEYLRHADAVLDALRDPTEAMKVAMFDKWGEPASASDMDDIATDMWQAGIDAAKRER